MASCLMISEQYRHFLSSPRLSACSSVRFFLVQRNTAPTNGENNREIISQSEKLRPLFLATYPTAIDSTIQRKNHIIVHLKFANNQFVQTWLIFSFCHALQYHKFRQISPLCRAHGYCLADYLFFAFLTAQ